MNDLAREEIDKTGMKPTMGMSFLTLPVTFDYSGGRKDKEKSMKMWAWILGVVGLLCSVGILFNKDKNFFFNLLISLALIVVFSSIIRFILLKEGTLRREKILLIDSDGKLDFQSEWGIYEVSDEYPHICRFRSGKSGLFVLLNKDVILGKFSEAEYEHYESIGDAYNICASSNIQMCHLDYMDIVGSDERIEESFESLSRVSNPDVRDVLTDIFTYQQEQMSKRITTFDAYLFLWGSANDEVAWNTIKRILACFMKANFRSYHVLDKDDLRELNKTIFLLQDFSVELSMLNAFNIELSRGIVPIKVTHSDGSEDIINLTQEQRKEQEELKAKQEEVKKQAKASKKKKSKDSFSDDEEIDLL